jgi:hypothetical protein
MMALRCEGSVQARPWTIDPERQMGLESRRDGSVHRRSVDEPRAYPAPEALGHFHAAFLFNRSSRSLGRPAEIDEHGRGGCHRGRARSRDQDPNVPPR